jgi:transcriptional regulator with XRE-family HTH domain
MEAAIMSKTKPIGVRLRGLRESAGLTQAALAETMGCSQGWIVQVESGRRPASLETLHRWAVALDLDPHDLDPRLARREGAPLN